MPRKINPSPDLPDHIKLFAELKRIPGTNSYKIKVQAVPVSAPWVVLAYFMEVVGTLANSTVGHNPHGIQDAETMADHVAQYITSSIMHSTAPNEPNERTKDNGKTTDQ